MRTWRWEVTFITFAFREITFEEFKRLLNDIAPKYGKDHKMDASKGYDAMVAAISGNGPSLAGTTVSNLTLLSTQYWMYIHIDDWIMIFLCQHCFVIFVNGVHGLYNTRGAWYYGVCTFNEIMFCVSKSTRYFLWYPCRVFWKHQLCNGARHSHIWETKNLNNNKLCFYICICLFEMVSCHLCMRCTWGKQHQISCQDNFQGVWLVVIKNTLWK